MHQLVAKRGQLLQALGRKRRFLKKSGTKNFCYAGSWALAAPTPRAQQSKSFLLLFFKKEALPTLTLSSPPH
jgi:hypothetical protein